MTTVVPTLPLSMGFPLWFCIAAFVLSTRYVPESVAWHLGQATFEREFGARVIDAFTDAYLDGATPNPCQACNQYIKFDELLRRADAALYQAKKSGGSRCVLPALPAHRGTAARHRSTRHGSALLRIPTR